MFGKCKVCVEKDKQLLVLSEEIKFLRALLQPMESVQNKFVQLEADAVISGNQEQIQIELTPEEEEVLAERDRVLSGNY